MPRRPRSSPVQPARGPSRTRRASKAERWLDLLAFLLDHHYMVSREAIYQGVADYRRDWELGTEQAEASLRRKFERDKKELGALGITLKPVGKVESDRSQQAVDAYCLRPGDLYLPYFELEGKARASSRRPYGLPALSLKPDEFALLRRAAERVRALEGTALAASASSALRKLSFDLPELEPGDGELSLGQPVDSEFAKRFATLKEGVERRLPVRCRYYAIGRDAEEERVIEPYGLMLSWGHWYLIGRAPEKDALRIFRLSRMRQVRLLERERKFEVPESFSVRDWLDRSPWELGESEAVPVEVRIAFPHSRWVIAEGLGEVLESADGAGGARFRFEVRAPEALVRWLLPFGGQAEVVSPPGIGERLAAERERIRALYAS